MLLLLLACAGSDGGSDDSGPSSEDTSTDDADTGPPGFACPAGMSPVPAESPAWCIDSYEVAVVDGALVSAPGMEPAVGYSYEAAAAACEASPALDASGAAYGTKHLATAEEWADAGDGVLGEGGTRYPWGDTFDDALCVTLSETGEAQFDGTQPTGSMPGCVSAFGLYDQVGNAWEWTDSGVVLDSDAALAALAAAGLTLAEAEDGTLLWVGGASDELFLDMAGLQPATFTVTPEGYMEVAASQIQPELSSFFARGYARTPAVPDVPLPVRLASTNPEDPGASWRLHAAREYDGRALPDKRGCAWYTGTAYACELTTASFSHLPDFDGTIGFRCVAPPYPL